jgi:hypothetical protein
MSVICPATDMSLLLKLVKDSIRKK